jgi:hypothetical protein
MGLPAERPLLCESVQPGFRAFAPQETADVLDDAVLLIVGLLHQETVIGD